MASLTARVFSTDYLEQLCHDFDLEVAREYRAFDDTYIYYFRDAHTRRLVRRTVLSSAVLENASFDEWRRRMEGEIEEAIKAAAQLTKRRD